MLAGIWIKRTSDEYRKLTGILAAGAILLAVSLIWDQAFPINKKIWTSSYVLYTGGIALLFLGVVYWLVDVLDYKGWIKPFQVYGVNPLFAYILSGVLAKLAYMISWETGAGTTQTVQGWIYDHFFLSWLSPLNASLGYGLLNVLVCLAAVWVLYRQRIYIKV
jgi:predicted acyltransferase